MSRSGGRPGTVASLLTVLGVISLWPFSGGEDVSNARENIISGNRTDFWGGFSQLFYSSFRFDAPTWHICLGLLHALFVWLGSRVAISILFILKRSRLSFLLLLVIHFFATIYVLSLSRDASLLAFAWLGIALLFRFFSVKESKFLILILGMFFLILGLSFRPWLAIAFTPLLVGIIHFSDIFKNKGVKNVFLIFASLSLSVTPLIFDISSKKFNNLKSSFPEQQVMILDISSMVCLSPDKNVQLLATTSLKPISNTSDLTREKICGQFYPQSWASLVFYSNPNDPALRMISIDDYRTYQTLRKSWLELIIHEPIQYIQVKIIQVSQLFFAGDSINLVPKTFFDIPLIPFEILKALRLFSFLPVLLFFSWITFSSRIQINSKIRKLIFLTYIFATLNITIAFIGDNQRYISWLSILLFFTYLIAPNKLRKEL